MHVSHGIVIDHTEKDERVSECACEKRTEKQKSRTTNTNAYIETELIAIRMLMPIISVRCVIISLSERDDHITSILNI